MSDHPTSQASPTGVKSSQGQTADPRRPQMQTHGDGDVDINVNIEDNFGVTRLSADQVKTARALHHLFQSLCGGQPGQYWPQALLDSAGRFNRPVFPARHNGGRQ